jgi:hypothetical protein
MPRERRLGRIPVAFAAAGVANVGIPFPMRTLAIGSASVALRFALPAQGTP